MRNYTKLDLIRFNKLANKNKDLKPVQLIKLYNEKYPEKTAKEKLINLSKALGNNNLHKALTAKELTEIVLIEVRKITPDMTKQDVFWMVDSLVSTLGIERAKEYLFKIYEIKESDIKMVLNNLPFKS